MAGRVDDVEGLVAEFDPVSLRNSYICRGRGFTLKDLDGQSRWIGQSFGIIFVDHNLGVGTLFQFPVAAGMISVAVCIYDVFDRVNLRFPIYNF